MAFTLLNLCQADKSSVETCEITAFSQTIDMLHNAHHGAGDRLIARICSQRRQPNKAVTEAR